MQCQPGVWVRDLPTNNDRAWDHIARMEKAATGSAWLFLLLIVCAVIGIVGNASEGTIALIVGGVVLMGAYDRHQEPEGERCRERQGRCRESHARRGRAPGNRHSGGGATAHQSPGRQVAATGSGRYWARTSDLRLVEAEAPRRARSACSSLQ
jgi:hypothetical protein